MIILSLCCDFESEDCHGAWKIYIKNQKPSNLQISIQSDFYAMRGMTYQYRAVRLCAFEVVKQQSAWIVFCDWYSAQTMI